jgi:hypothetical protein
LNLKAHILYGLFCDAHRLKKTLQHAPAAGLALGAGEISA